MIRPEILEILRCPETMQRLAPASPEILARLAALPGGKGGGLLESGLVREDGRVLYPVRDGIPLLMIEEAIALPEAAPAAR